MADQDYSRRQSAQRGSYGRRYPNDSYSRSYSADRESATGRTRQRVEVDYGDAIRESYSPSARGGGYSGTSNRRSGTGYRSSADRQRSSAAERSSRRARTTASSRAYEADEELSNYTRRDSRLGQESSRPSSRSSRRGYAQQPPRQSIPEKILSVLAAIGIAIVNAVQWIADRVPLLEGSLVRGFAAVAAVLVLVVVGVNFAFGGHGAQNGPEAAEVQDVQQVEEEPAAIDTSAVNPNQPADLKWRDESFAINPDFKDWKTRDNGRKVVYLTIDDGPSELTPKLLDMLDTYNVKATFFVTGHDPACYSYIQDAYNRGHTIGLHSMTHDYSQIYSSESAFYADLEQVGKVVQDQIGYVPYLIRFPGGSSNGISSEYSQGLMPKLVKGVLERGYQYYDWSLSSGDGEVHTAQELISLSTEPNGAGAGLDPTRDTNIVLLCHDAPTKQSTLDALPTIIETYQKRGYTFEAIDRDTWVCHHAVEGLESSSGSQGANADASASRDGQDADDDGYTEGGYQDEDGDGYPDEDYGAYDDGSQETDEWSYDESSEYQEQA